MLKRVLPLLLLLGAWIGLLGQQVAFAQSADLARPITVTQQVAAMSDMDCAGMAMASHNDGKSSVPCKKMTLDCIAQMSCSAPVVLNEDFGPADVIPLASPYYGPMPATSLAGRSDGPEPHPPSLI